MRQQALTRLMDQRLGGKLQPAARLEHRVPHHGQPRPALLEFLDQRHARRERRFAGEQTDLERARAEVLTQGAGHGEHRLARLRDHRLHIAGVLHRQCRRHRQRPAATGTDRLAVGDQTRAATGVMPRQYQHVGQLR